MKIHTLFARNSLRNFTYIIEKKDKTAIVVDPYDALQATRAIREKKLILTTIINTHEHWDHTSGNRELVDTFGAQVYAHHKVVDKIPGGSKGLFHGERIEVDEESELVVWDTPGHTLAHVCLMLQKKGQMHAFFSGDTLFNAGIGHCRAGGDIELYYETLTEQLMKLPDATLLYPGHEYMQNNLNFTLSIEKNNEMAKSLLGEYEKKVAKGEWPVVTIGVEKEVNTFFRFQSPVVQKGIEERSKLKAHNLKEHFINLRSLRDQW